MEAPAPPFAVPPRRSGWEQGDALAATRWRIVERLGAGAEGMVFAVEDLDLDRVVAIKTLTDAGDPKAVARFLTAARLAAALDHPNVPTIYDITGTAEAAPCLVMKRISGITLGAALRGSATASRHPAVATLNDVVTIFIGVGNAVAFAHAQGIRHHDIKPDNIVLGDFGQAVLADWGAARRGYEPAVSHYGTPLYMSPEQARGEAVDDRSDQYALAASLFEAALLRTARRPGEAEELLVRCRSGALDDVSPGERAAVPARLLAIIMKGLGASADDRYDNVDLFLSDLRAFQAGLAVSAYRDRLTERLMRMLRRHGRALVAGFATFLLIAGLAWLLVAERIKEFAHWGQPLLVESFVGDAWHGRWQVIAGGFAAAAGGRGLVTIGAKRNVLALRQRLEGDIVIEYEACSQDGAYPADLSLLWRETPFVTGAWDDPQPTYCCAVGDYDGCSTAITLRPNKDYCDWCGFRVLPGVIHRMRIEIIGERITVAVDGTTRCTYAANLPFQGGYMALYGFYPGKRFSDVRIRALGLPEKLPATAVGDALLRAGHLGEAETQYLRVGEARGSALADQARLRAGLCALSDARPLDAQRDWDDLASVDARLRAALLAAEDGFTRGGPPAPALSAIAAAAGAPEQRAAAALTWNACIREILNHRLIRQAEPFLALRAHALLGLQGPRPLAAQALLALGRYPEVLRDFADIDQFASQALIRLGRGADVLTQYPAQRFRGIEALEALGRWDEIPDRFCRGMTTPDASRGQVEHGAPELRLHDLPDDVFALLALGRLEDAVRATPGKDPDWVVRAYILAGQPLVGPQVCSALSRMSLLMAQGRLEPALAFAPDCARERCWPEALLALRAAIAGDHVASVRAFAELTDDGLWDQGHATFAHFVIAPFLSELRGDSGAFDRAAARALACDRGLDQQRPWYRAAYASGRISREDFLTTQPYRLFAPAEVLLLDACRAELDGQPARASLLYEQYLKLPAWRRGIDIDPVLEEFARWRRNKTAA